MISEVSRPFTTSALQEMVRSFRQRAGQYDRQGAFVYENYAELKGLALFSAMVPQHCGGGGMPYVEMCTLIRQIGQHCGSTALAFGMHQHLIAASNWKLRQRGLGAALLQKVASEQLVLVSTGARDWLGSNGEMVRVDGGYLLTADKRFASGSPIGDIAISSAPYHDPKEGSQVLHFPVSLKAEGVTILDDWHVMGMRGTGSHTIQFRKTFIPEDKIALRRPQHEFHPVWNVVLTVAMPLIMSAYVGLAERAAEIALKIGRKYMRNQTHLPYILGKLNNQLVSAQVQWSAMQELVNEFDFTPDRRSTSKTLTLKTNVADACVATVQLAMEAIGGQGFYEKNELERIFRDVHASAFHPLPKWDQYAFAAEGL